LHHIASDGWSVEILKREMSTLYQAACAGKLSPLAELRSVVSLEFGGDWHSPRIAHVDSIAFLRKMPQLKALTLHTMIVDDLDYSPVLALAQLQELRVMKVRGMRPPFEEIRGMAPWAA